MSSKISITINQLHEITGGRLVGHSDDLIINLNRIEFAIKGEMTFYADKAYLEYLEKSLATCIIIDEKFDFAPKDNQVFIFLNNPYQKFVELIKLIDSKQNKPTSGIHPTAIICDGASVHETASIGPYCYVGSNSEIGSNCLLSAGVIMGNDVIIGEGTKIYPNATIYHDVKIGSNCIIHAGAVIGSDGFGYLEQSNGIYDKIPQIGDVVIGNNVEIGSNTTIDRAMIGSTIIEDGVKLDNLIQIAHNVIIGENSAFASQVGIAGSTKIGKRNRFGGQVGVSGHIFTQDDVILTAQSGVPSSITKRGIYFGAPAREHIRALRIEGAINNLPELAKELNSLRKKVDELEMKLKSDIK